MGFPGSGADAAIIRPVNAPTSQASTPVAAVMGGSVSLAGKASLVIPAGAMATNQTITVVEYDASTLPVTDSNTRLVSSIKDFKPDGLTFSRPVLLSLNVAADVAASRGPALTVFYFNPQTGLWERVGGSLTADLSAVVTNITHFSY